ncbi:hypothetical protein A3D78_07460 [Candidatus Gottesmanbacteria bacterium RIFCSPHIGHO2_02_FULL_39_14]|uniref:Uncharacterized protein n=3 Tax=Candidatus Gottesmaniibacteriota TaxID=1752720 RepID=A0A1F5ZZQ8_9BACT|nr:MAG: hypothetical protein A2153_02620 [Candidatus Gottesmanbacteria bacterium RBG_16_38_7b]OGG17959.1 MAG: hypothetical protein A3D78_07460 [Candidatus Gottesmanbacteria bacterium RIFCSPHIGHO2_02_FULL_39_14]OGG30823.1 MAG: hypothetical protein A3I51_04625 [Candidatus Gottesmanbacteria bacterium RIFCSPLOWO2_02_FULL_38_8]
MTAQLQPNSSDSNSQPPKSQTVSTPIHGKEAEIAPVSVKEDLKEISAEIEIPQEVKKTGVQEIRGTIDLPPDIQKLGVIPSAPQASVSAAITTASLPLSDDKILQGVNAPVTSALKWLAFWCLRNLRKAHLVLKLIHGKIIRVRIK